MSSQEEKKQLQHEEEEKKDELPQEEKEIEYLTMSFLSSTSLSEARKEATMSSQEEIKQLQHEEEEKKDELPQKEEEEIRYLTMSTLDNVEIVVEESIAILSNTINNMVEDGCASDVIPVQVDSRVMAKVIEYCTKHVGEETAKEAEKEALKEFDEKYAEEHNTDMLYFLLVAANFLDIPGLLHLIAQRVADLIKGKTPEQIRTMFKIKNDFTPEEEEEIRTENPWAFD